MGSGDSNGYRVKKGDIVWARVHFPHAWSPALVLTSDDLGVSVSFPFSDQNDHVFSTKTTYYLESEVVPFEEAFPSLMPRRRTTNGDALLHSALRLFGQKVISSLRCCCLVGHRQAQRAPDGSGHSSEFDPVEVLGFVLDAAVSPWVEAPRFAHAVRVVAQVHAFRAYSSLQHKKMYRQTLKTGANVKLYPCSSFDQKTHSVTQESVALEHMGKCQIISKHVETRLPVVAKRRLKSTVPVLERNLFKNKFLIISKNLKLPPALHPLHVVGEGMVDICFGKHSMMSKTPISVPSNLKGHLSNCTNKRKDNALGRYCRLPDKETTIYLNNKKRRLHKAASCHVTPQIGRVQENEGNAYISKYTRPWVSTIRMLEPEGTIQKDNLADTCFSETNMNCTDEVQKMDLRRGQQLTIQQPFTCKSSANLVLAFHSDNCEVDAGADKGKGLLGTNSSVYQERLQMSCDGDTAPLELKESTKIKLSCWDHLVEGKDCYQGVASCSIYNSKVGQQPKTHVPICSTSLYMKFPKNFNLPSKEQLIKKFRVFGSINSSKTRVSYYTGSAQLVFLEETDASVAYLYAKKRAWFGEGNVRFWLDPFEHKRRGFNCCALMSSKHIGPPLKSCLKKSNSSRQENRKKHRRVRFTIET
ncbi:uncharacterized protein LOC113856614 [Abrus precatorius]|uniref:Uncharacterized protein LOC113856614 n=1 Tax=Abrus precatorius TaxID=3816 RepID=A0A8B8KKH5_ABRPR|nr:uncharacterized protein LOC113856614 [Abrus precatorius]